MTAEAERVSTSKPTHENRSSDMVVTIVKYVLIFWGVCVAAGSGMAVGLANSGMKPQDAFSAGALIAFLPAVVVGVCLVVYFIFFD